MRRPASSLFPLTALLILALPALAGAQGMLMPDAGKPAHAFTLESQQVRVSVTDGVASYEVDQVFRNHTAEMLEATYVLPLPTGSTVSDFAIWINGAKATGSLLSRSRALQIYEEIVARLVDPGLLEYVDADLVQARIFPIPAGETQRVQTRFTSLVPVEGDTASLRYPLRIFGAGEDAAVRMEIELTDARPVRAVYSPSHPVTVTRDGERTFVTFERAAQVLDRDLQLYYTFVDEPLGMTLLTSRQPGEDGYFLLVAAPGDAPDAAVLPKDITFAVDTSGSMTGDKMDGVRDALDHCLRSLGPADRFTVVQFADTALTFAPTPVPATEDNVLRALAFVDGFEPLGGTNIHAAIDASLASPPSGDRPHYVVLLTDGRPTVGVTSGKAIAELAAERTAGLDGQVRIFAFALGYDIETSLLDTVTGEHGGTAAYLQPGEDVAWRINSFFRRVSRPVLTQLALDLGGADAYDVFPRELPDLYSGTQLVVMGRYKGRGTQPVRLTGVASGVDHGVTQRMAFHDKRGDCDEVPRLWASRKVGFLLDEIRREGETPERIEEVANLGHRFGILTPYTSFLSQEELPVASLLPSTAEGADALQVLWDREARATMSPDVFDGMWEVTGGSAVATSVAIQQLQGTTAVAMHDPGRAVGDRVFQYCDGIWIDTAFDPAMDTLTVRAMSDGYFALLRKHPELRRVAALGDSVVVALGPDRALFFTPFGEETRGTKLDAFLGAAERAGRRGR